MITRPRGERGAFALLVLLSCLLPTTASAHPKPGSFAFVDRTVDGARLEQDVPVEELELALGEKLGDANEAPGAIVLRHRDRLLSYAASHVRAENVGTGGAWRVAPIDVVGHPSEDGRRARFELALVPPQSGSAEAFRLHDGIVTHELVSHYTTVFLRSDWTASRSIPTPRLLGTLHAGRLEVNVAPAGSPFQGFRGVVRLGMEHIATGIDHLLFLFALLLVAPVAAAGGRWGEHRTVRETLGNVARIVSAFTVGHSVTLALGAIGLASVPSALVEMAIAISLLVAAAHAARPIFPRRETWIAGGFGLVHGLAFASALSGRDLGRAQAAWALLGFNVGIELAQLAVLFLVLPWILILARTRIFTAFRAAGAGTIGVLACGWFFERSSSLTNPFARPLGFVQSHPLLPVLALALIALGARYGSLTARRAHPEAAQDNRGCAGTRPDR